MSVKLIGITGGSGSGKSTVVKRIEAISSECLLIEQDNYYKSAPQVNNENITAVNFDHPDAFDMDLMLENLMDLKKGRSVMMPQYDFVTHSRTGSWCSMTRGYATFSISRSMWTPLRISDSSGDLKGTSQRGGGRWRVS